MSRGQEGDNVRDMFHELHADWTNWETFAAHRHLTSDEGLVRTASASLHLTEMVEGAVTPEVAGDTLAGLLARHLDELDDAGLVDERRTIREGIGSFWRVNWAEVGAAFLGNEMIAA